MKYFIVMATNNNNKLKHDFLICRIIYIYTVSMRTLEPVKHNT